MRTISQNKLMTDYAVGPGGSLNSQAFLFFLLLLDYCAVQNSQYTLLEKVIAGLVS